MLCHINKCPICLINLVYSNLNQTLGCFQSISKRTDAAKSSVLVSLDFRMKNKYDYVQWPSTEVSEIVRQEYDNTRLVVSQPIQISYILYR